MARNGFVPVETQGQDVERDDDAAMEGDIFDSADDIFDAENEEDSDGEGIFSDNASVFSAARSPSEDHSNAITTREMEKRRYEDAKPHESMKAAREVYNKRAGFKSPPKPKRVLVAKFDDQGRPIVAHFAGGKQLEPFRAPTQKEFLSLKTKGRIVKGGIGQTETPPAAPAPNSGLPWKTILLGGVGVVAVGGAAWYLWRRRKNALENTVVESVPEAAAAGLDDTEDED